MTMRRPVVMASGALEQIQTGDALTIPDSSGLQESSVKTALQPYNNDYTLPSLGSNFLVSLSKPFSISSHVWNNLYSPNQGSVWICGNSGAIARSTTSGYLWSVHVHGTANWRSVFALDANTAWVCGDGGAISKTTNGGSSWTDQTSGTSNQLHQIVFSDALNGWAISYYDILHTTNGGSSWTPLLSSIPTGVIQCIQMLTSSLGWISTLAGLWQTTNGGTSWSLINSSIYGFQALNFVDSLNGFLITGLSVDIAADIVKSVNGGVTIGGMSSIPPGIFIDSFRTVSALSNTSVWAAGARGILISVSDGSDFTIIPAGYSSDIIAMKMWDPYTGIALGGDGTIISISLGAPGILYNDGTGTLSWTVSSYWSRGYGDYGKGQLYTTQPYDVITDHNYATVFDIDYRRLDNEYGDPVMDFSDPFGTSSILVNNIADYTYTPSAKFDERALCDNSGNEVVYWGDGFVVNGETYPSGDGAAGTFMTTDGSGNLGWSTVFFDGTSLNAQNILLPECMSPTQGVIYQYQTLPGYPSQPYRMLHTYHDPAANGSNVFVGINAGNFTMGPAGGAALLGSYNTCFGQDSGFAITTGFQNSFYGANAGVHNTTGQSNIYFGTSAGGDNATGAANTAIGTLAGEKNVGGTFNVSFGYCAGRWEDGSNTLYIDGYPRSNGTTNPSSDPSLGKSLGIAGAAIYGIFDPVVANQILRFNACVGVNGSPSAWMTLPSSDGSPNHAPLKILSGTTLSAHEHGAIESDGTHLYWTDDTGTRKTIV